ncbi:MAG: hypothetical protein UH963_06650 [Agathobacter sp.]|nr:hypothetical protein [Agathobacter sp.]
MNRKDIETFNKAVESLRQYRRYEIVDENNKNLLDDIYVDPIEGDALLRLCIKDNTTVLVGRKGTGKSTIFMKMQNELRKSKEVMTCYIDVKTIFDTAKRNYMTINYLKANNSKEIENYSIQRQFILDFVSELISEISKNYKTKFDQLKDKFHIPSKVNGSIKKLEGIRDRIQNNAHLGNIELQTLQEVNLSVIEENKTENSICGKVEDSIALKDIGVKSSVSGEAKFSNANENEKKYNRVFARIFEITELVEEIKKVLQDLEMKRLYLILDDYSEIDQDSLRMFCDLIVNTLNNTSDNYIKLKISAYPGRVELGELDRQKIDIRYLDYYQLYVNDKRTDMEKAAVNYTQRIIENRLKIFTQHGIDYYFDTEKASVEEYCTYLFRMTLNVVRHLGLILDYAQEYSIARNEKITMVVLNEASKRFYNERLSLFFEEGKSAQMAYDERVEIFHLRTLLLSIIQREKEIKTSIRTNKYTAKIFDAERTNPYTSHFYISKQIEHILGSLELNFFVNKYNEMSSKNGEKVSIYALNYGLCLNENLRWGKPDGSEARTYFIESPFNFNNLLKDFLKDTKEIVCDVCGYVYSEDDLDILKRHNMNCLECGAKNSVVVKKRISDSYKKEIEEIEKKGNLLERDQYIFMKLAIIKGGRVTAREMSLELDVTSQKVGWITKKLEEEFYYLSKSREAGNTIYTISELGKQMI